MAGRCGLCGGTERVSGELGVCVTCRVRRRSVVGHSPAPDSFDWAAVERKWDEWMGMKVVPIGRRLTAAERRWLVAEALRQGVTEIERIKDLVGLEGRDARRLIDEVSAA